MAAGQATELTFTMVLPRRPVSARVTAVYTSIMFISPSWLLLAEALASPAAARANTCDTPDYNSPFIEACDQSFQAFGSATRRMGETA